MICYNKKIKIIKNMMYWICKTEKSKKCKLVYKHKKHNTKKNPTMNI